MASAPAGPALSPTSPGRSGGGARPAGLDARILVLAGLATFFVNLDGSVLALALPAVASEFHSSLRQLTDLGSVLALGALLGLPVAMLADRWGRRRVLVASVAAFSVADVGSALAPSLSALAALRLLAVCFETVATAVAISLVVEEVDGHRRGLAVAVVTVAAGLGTGLTTVAYPLLAPRWRLLYLAGGTGLLAAAALHRLLPEGRAWAAARRGGVPLWVLLGARWRWRLAVVTAAGGLGAILYQPAGLLVALYGSRQLELAPSAISAVIVVSGLASAPAFLVGGRLSDRLGRRGLAAALSAATAACCAVTFIAGVPGYWAGSLLWSVLASAAVPVLGAWSGELFPTGARATSESAGAVALAVGGIAGLQFVGLAQPVLGLGPSLAVAALAALLGAALLLLLPETRGQPLPD